MFLVLCEHSCQERIAFTQNVIDAIYLCVAKAFINASFKLIYSLAHCFLTFTERHVCLSCVVDTRLHFLTIYCGSKSSKVQQQSLTFLCIIWGITVFIFHYLFFVCIIALFLKIIYIVTVCLMNVKVANVLCTERCKGARSVVVFLQYWRQ